jgi:hypothetical protein
MAHVIPVPGRLKQDVEFETSLGNIDPVTNKQPHKVISE